MVRSVKHKGKIMAAGALAAILLCLFAACGFNGVPTIEADPVSLDRSPVSYGDDSYPTQTGSARGQIGSQPEQSGTGETNASLPPLTDNSGRTIPQPPQSANNGSTQRSASPSGTNRGNEIPQTQPQTEGRSQLPVPVNTAEIIKMYNEATQKVNSQRPSMRKKTNTTVEYIDGIEPLQKASIVGVNARKEIGTRLGEGEQTKNVPRGQDSGALLTSTLTQADVNGTSCDQDGDVYTLTIQVKNADNPEHNRNTPISRFTNDFVPGSKAKYDIEHLTVAGFKVNATVESVQLHTKNVKIVAKIDAYTGRPLSIVHTFGFNVEMYNVKGSFAGIKEEMPEIKGAGNTRAEFNSFSFSA